MQYKEAMLSENFLTQLRETNEAFEAWLNNADPGVREAWRDKASEFASYCIGYFYGEMRGKW